MPLSEQERHCIELAFEERRYFIFYLPDSRTKSQDSFGENADPDAQRRLLLGNTYGGLGC